MTLPPNFSHWEHLQDMLRREHNRVVARYFRDLGDGWEPNIDTPRSALRTSVTIDDNDTDVMTLIRLYLFYEVLGYGRKRLGNIYGIPAERFQESVAGKPEIFLYFSQDSSAVPKGQTRIDAEYSFRLMHESSETMTEQKARNLAVKIRDLFKEGGRSWEFTKGKSIVTYKDVEKGYRLAIYATNTLEGVGVIKKILSIQGHIFEADRVSTSNPEKNSINKPTKKKRVYGKNIDEVRWRPVANVKFRYAYMYLHGLKNPVYLVDFTGYYPALAR